MKRCFPSNTRLLAAAAGAAMVIGCTKKPPEPDPELQALSTRPLVVESDATLDDAFAIAALFGAGAKVRLMISETGGIGAVGASFVLRKMLSSAGIMEPQVYPGPVSGPGGRIPPAGALLPHMKTLKQALRLQDKTWARPRTDAAQALANLEPGEYGLLVLGAPRALVGSEPAATNPFGAGEVAPLAATDATSTPGGPVFAVVAACAGLDPQGPVCRGADMAFVKLASRMRTHYALPPGERKSLAWFLQGANEEAFAVPYLKALLSAFSKDPPPADALYGAGMLICPAWYLLPGRGAADEPHRTQLLVDHEGLRKCMQGAWEKLGSDLPKGPDGTPLGRGRWTDGE